MKKIKFHNHFFFQISKMSDNGDDDDSMVINTASQIQITKKLAAKKDKLNVKKKLKGEKLGLKKNLKEKKLTKKKDGTDKKIAKKSEAQKSDETVDDLLKSNGFEKDYQDLDNKIGKPPRKEWNNVVHSSSKNAKFSSLFKNNHEIPHIGE